MPDIKELFNTLDDGANGGDAPDKKIEGDAPGTGSNAFSYKDSDGNVTLPQLDDAGRIKVDPKSTASKINDNLVLSVMKQILCELKLMNIHLAQITDLDNEGVEP